MHFFLRIACASLTLVLLTGLLIWRGPQTQDISLVAFGPNGTSASTGSVISLSFSRPVDQLSAEQAFRITPEVEGRFFWHDSTLTFRPSELLATQTDYRIELAPGLIDQQGRSNREEIGWEFRTRGPQLLVIASDESGAATLSSVPTDGSPAQQIASLPGGILAATLAPNQQQLVVSTLREDQRSALLVVNLADGTSYPLFDDPTVSADEPAWANLDDFIAFVRRTLIDGALGQPRIWLAQPDGTSYGPLLGTDDLAFAPVWSPDGGKVAYINSQTGELGVFNFFTQERHTLSAGSGEPATWSPDNSALIYTGTSPDLAQAPLQLRRWDAESNAISDLTDGESMNHSPRWSPTGELVAFVRQETDGPDSSIWVMQPDGSEQRPLTEGAQDRQPSWSPDGKQLAFIRINAEGLGSAWVIDLATGELREVEGNAEQLFWIS